ncbi:MAG: efflux RND transporter periplasmic adaptor subunit [Gammaproteobacteria bacterium]|nr:efflux RND transporter periplasmic adaptor subunit [Gammaproteobacteria bacterium]
MRALTRTGAFLLASMFTTLALAEQDYPFEVYPLKPMKVPVQQVLDGTVEAVNRSTVSAQTSGQVMEINYDVDDYVDKNAVLVRLRDNTQRADLDRANAGLEEARSRFIEARDEQQRVAELYERKLLAKAKLDAANATLNATQAQVKSAEAQLRQASEQLSNTVIKAPYSGIVTERHVEVGEIANPGEPLMTGISLEKLRISVNVPQRVIAAVRESGKAQIVFDNGAVIESDNLVFFPYADPQTNSFQVRIGIEEAVKGVFPGMFAKVVFTIDETEKLLVPESAIAYRSELTGIYVTDESGRVNLRQVRLGRHVNDDMVEILAGAEAGQTVALDPAAAGIYVKEQSQSTTAGE